MGLSKVILGTVLVGMMFSMHHVNGQDISKPCDQLFPIVSQEGKEGFIDHTGRVVVKPWLKSAGWLRSDVGYVETEHGEGFIDIKGNITILNGVELSSGFNEGFAFAKILKHDGSRGKWGFINMKGEVVFETKRYVEFAPYQEGLMIISNLLTVQHTRHTKLNKPSDPLSFLPPDDKAYYLDRKGIVQFGQGFDAAYPFKDGYAFVNLNGKDAIIDRQGNYVLGPQSKHLVGVSEGLILEHDKGERAWIYRNLKGDIVLKVFFRNAQLFSEGLAAISGADGKTGFIDKKGNIVIEPKFDSAHNFSEGLAAVEINNKIGFVNKRGEIVIKPQLIDDYAGLGFRCGLVDIETDAYRGYMNKKGGWVWKSRKIN